jgi:hypothetical protein
MQTKRIQVGRFGIVLPAAKSIRVADDIVNARPDDRRPRATLTGAAHMHPARTGVALRVTRTAPNVLAIFSLSTV